jgi:hypothetical protein
MHLGKGIVMRLLIAGELEEHRGKLGVTLRELPVSRGTVLLNLHCDVQDFATGVDQVHGLASSSAETAASDGALSYAIFRDDCSFPITKGPCLPDRNVLDKYRTDVMIR